MIATVANLFAVCLLLMPAPTVYICCAGDAHVDVVQFRGRHITLDAKFRHIHRHCTLDHVHHDHGHHHQHPAAPDDSPVIEQQAGDTAWYWLVPADRVESSSTPPNPGAGLYVAAGADGFVPTPFSRSRAPPKIGRRLAMLGVHLL